MSDNLIFVFGGLVSFMVVLGTFLFTFVEFRRMGRNPERYQLKRVIPAEKDEDKEKLAKSRFANQGNG